MHVLRIGLYAADAVVAAEGSGRPGGVRKHLQPASAALDEDRLAHR